LAERGHPSGVDPAVAGEDGPPALEFGLLGPMTVTVRGRPVELPGTRTRAVLALLLLQANAVVSADRLVDDLWAGAPTPGATATLQGYVSELRKALADALGGPAPVDTRRPGYLIRVEPAHLDLLRFDALVERARAAGRTGDGPVAGLLREALALWRGPALADFADEPFARPVATRLEETRLWALEERIEAELRDGRHNELVTELPRVIDDNPLRERLWGQWMLALYRSGRQAEALRAYQELRRRLGEELAIDPSPALQRLEQSILLQEPALEPPPAPADADPAALSRPTAAVAEVADAVPGLPVHFTRFVGRGAELERARTLLAAGRLLTLAGSAGSGKTRLAVELATRVAASFGDGVRFVDLAAATDPSQVPAAVATALGMQGHGVGGAVLCDRIADDEVLLLFDNCEHVVEAACALVQEILSRCPGAKVVATSQEELGISGETVLRVPSLSVPAGGDHAATADLLASEAVQLFVDRSAVAGPDIAHDRAALAAAGRICVRLDGIPLAIELAAGLVPVLALDEIVHRLDDRFALLTRSSRQAVPRHRTLRAAIDWSYELLEASERELFQRLSVFVGEFGVDAAAAVGAPDGDFLADLSALVSKSMLTTVPGPGGARRYRLLDSLRQYGLEKLRSAGTEAETRRRHAAHYTAFAVAADRRLHGPDATDWSTRMVEERSNLRDALDWCFSGGDLELGIELAGALRWWFFGRLTQLVQVRKWLEDALARTDELSPRLRLKALIAVMTVAFSQGDYHEASDRGEEAVALAEALGDHGELAVALMTRGGAAVFEGKLDRAVECLRNSLRYCDELGDRWGRAWVLTFWGIAARRANDPVLARAHLEEALSIFRAVHDDHNQVIPLAQLALVAQQGGDLVGAARYCDDAIALAHRLGDRQLAHGAACVAGRVALARGRREEGRELLRSSLRSYRGAENQLVVALAVEGLAIVAHEDGRDADGAALWGYADELRTTRSMPLTAERLAERERHLERARHRLGTDETELAVAGGRRLGIHEVLALIDAAGPAPVTPRS
jgi:predicted ATPase/DNA-binding SARP family transcriptional activator